MYIECVCMRCNGLQALTERDIIVRAIATVTTAKRLMQATDGGTPVSLNQL